MGKTLKYVSEFTFPSDKGYSGSAGQQMVKGYARGGSCGPMKKADGGAVDNPRRPLMERTLPEYIDEINREREMADRMKAQRAMEMADRMMAETETGPETGQYRRPRLLRSQGLRSPRAEMARERAIMGQDTGYAKGGMAMRKQYPTNNGKPMISGPKAAPAPKADMLYSKKENSAKNLLADGKAPNLPSAKGGVNMAKGGSAKVGKVMGEFKEGKLHSGSKSGPVVKSRKQAIAIGLSEARKGKK